MPSESDPPAAPHELAWHITSRWWELVGETRANLLRSICVVGLFAIELAHHHGLRMGLLEVPPAPELTPRLHRAVTFIVAGWVLLAFAIHFCLARRVFPPWLKYVSSLLDICLLTMILLVGLGPRSPLVAGYFLLICLSSLRFSLPLIRATTLGCMLAYLTVCGHARWFGTPEHAVPRYHQVLVLAALALAGIAQGQIVRGIRGIAAEFASRVASPHTPSGT